ncbi:MAG: tetratricopeptide repeat protein [Actinobacteria bacterium]|nr:tetratricopeptide repeat protein [Actinomycetota bacterium]
MSSEREPVPDDARKVELLLDAGRTAQARVLGARLLASDPDDPELLRLLARVHLVDADPGGAIGFAHRAVAAEPDDAQGHGLASLAWGGVGHGTNALASAREATRIAPDAWWTWVQLSAVATGDPQARRDAVPAAERAVRLAPSEAAAHRALGDALSRRPRASARDRRAAKAAYAAALRLDPASSHTLNNLALVALDSGDLLAAATGFADAARADPGDGVAAANVDVVVDRLLLRLLVVLSAVVPVVGLASLAAPGTVLAALGIPLLAVVLPFSLVRLRRLPPGVRARARHRVLTEPGPRLLASASAVALTALVLLMLAELTSVPRPAFVAAYVLTPPVMAAVLRRYVRIVTG